MVLAVTIFSKIRVRLGAPIATQLRHTTVATVIAADHFAFLGSKANTRGRNPCRRKMIFTTKRMMPTEPIDL